MTRMMMTLMRDQRWHLFRLTAFSLKYDGNVCRDEPLTGACLKQIPKLSRQSTNFIASCDSCHVFEDSCSSSSSPV